MKLNELLPFSEHESVDIDYKLHLDKNNPKSWAKSIVAFSNGEGGCLAIGADNDGNVVGVSAGEVDESKNLVYRIVDRMVKPGIVPLKFEPTKVGEDRFLLLLRIGKAHQMMFLREGDYSETVYVRKDGASVPASLEELKWMFFEKRSFSFDSEPTPTPFSIELFSKLADYYRQEFPDESALNKSLLLSTGAITPDGFVTRGGQLFMDDCPNRDCNCHCRLWPGTDKGSDATLDDKEYKGNAIELFEFMYAFVARNAKSGLVKVEGGHVRVPSYPKRAVEEALWNAIAHRDYLIEGAQIDVDIFEDRLEICSPGSFLPGNLGDEVGLENIPSRRRNNVICDVLALVNKMQRNGSGFRKIAAEYKDAPYDHRPRLRILPNSCLIALYDMHTELNGQTVFSGMSEKERRFAAKILEECGKGPRSSAELLALTDYRSKNSLMNNLIKPLLDAGLLAPTEASLQSPLNKFVRK